jgi:hypothetical protein
MQRALAVTSSIKHSMKSKTSKIWATALLLILICIVFPPRRDTEQGRDRDGIPTRRFLWSNDLYKGSLTPGVQMGARIDLEKLALELSALAALTSAIAVGAGCCCRSDKQP